MATSANLILAAGDNPQLLQALQSLSEQVSTLMQTTAPTSGVPSVCGFSVQGVDGSLVIDIDNPQDVTFSTIKQRQQAASILFAPPGATVTHQIQTSLSLLFDSANDTRTYGPDTKTHWEMTDTPAQNRFIRLRSSYNGGQTWNKWVIYSDPLTCGPLPIFTGQIRSFRESPNAQFNVTNFATVDAVVDGSNADIRVYGLGGIGTAWTKQVGLVKTGPYPAATLTGYAQGTTYDVYWDSSAGIYQVFDPATEFPQSLADQLVWAGEVMTPVSSPSAPVATAIVVSGFVVSVSLTSAGTGIISPPTVAFVAGGGGGSGAAAYCVLDGAGGVKAVIVTSAGSLYTVAPTVTFSGGGTGQGGGGGNQGSGGGGSRGGGGDRGL